MIYKAITTALESIPELSEKLRPNTELIDSIEPPFGIYYFKSRASVTVMSGVVIYNVDKIVVELYDKSYDNVHALYKRCCDALSILLGQTVDGIQIINVVTGVSEAEGSSIGRSTQVVPMTVEVWWR